MKGVFLTPVPAPYQIAFAKALQPYMDIQFWFMTSIKDSTRPAYWEMPLPEYCKILPTYFRKRQLFYCPSLTKRLNEWDPDFIVLHGKWNNMSWFLAYRWAKKHNKKVLMGPLEIPTHKNWIKESLRKILYQKIDVFLCVGYRSLDYYGTVKEKNKAVLLSYAADLERELTHEPRKPSQTITFLHSGSMNERFRVLTIMDVFENIARDYQNIRLVLSGNGPLKETCQKRIQNSPLLLERVSWIEVKSWNEVQDIYLSADVLISYPSYAGWGLTIPEAMASGMGIIAGNSVESARELIINGYNGYLVRNDEDLLGAMQEYIQNPELITEHANINKKIAPIEGVFAKAKTLHHVVESLS